MIPASHSVSGSWRKSGDNLARMGLGIHPEYLASAADTWNPVDSVRKSGGQSFDRA